MAEDIVRWGILSTAQIGSNVFVPALRDTKRGRLSAIASRQRHKAQAFARTFDVPNVFDDYAGVLASDEVDAVYIPLPNSMHAEWTIRAAEAGKHVFCEKPLGIDAAEAARMVDVCRKAGIVFFEAFVFCYHPQTHHLRRIVESGRIGELKQLFAAQHFHLPRPTENIRFCKALGGGSIFDVGVYPITFARHIFGDEPESVQAVGVWDPDYEVDSRISMLLSFSGHRTALLSGSFDAFGGARAMLYGSEAHIDIPQPYHPREQSEFSIVVGKEKQTDVVSFANGVRAFTPAIDHFHDCILDGKQPQLTAENAIGTLRVVEAAIRSARTGERVQI